jgi:hypothetical protein
MIDETRLRWDAYQEAEETHHLDPEVLQTFWYPRWIRLAEFMEERFPGFDYRPGVVPAPADPRDPLLPMWCSTTAGWYFVGESFGVFVAPEWPRDNFQTGIGEDEVHLTFRHQDFKFEGSVAGGLDQLEGLLSRLLREPSDEEIKLSRLTLEIKRFDDQCGAKLLDEYWRVYKEMNRKLFPDD